MRPDRIIVDEIRGVEAYDFLEAINTGHPGAITTIHADSPALAFDRLALMVMRSGVRLSHREIINLCEADDRSGYPGRTGATARAGFLKSICHRKMRTDFSPVVKFDDKGQRDGCDLEIG
jgi:hypothetical protein